MSEDVKLSIENVGYFQELLHITFSDVSDSYEVLNNYDGDLKYILSQNYLTMSHQSFLKLKRVHHEYGLHHYEIDSFLSGYEDYKFQLKQVITERDSNTSWLSSTFEKLQETKNQVNEFVSNWIKNSSK